MIDVGSHVVCIRDKWISIPKAEKMNNTKYHRPIKGMVYTVRTVEKNDKGTWLRFAELLNPLLGGFLEAQYNIEYFKPLKKLRIEDFLTQNVKDLVDV